MMEVLFSHCPIFDVQWHPCPSHCAIMGCGTTDGCKEGTYKVPKRPLRRSSKIRRQQRRRESIELIIFVPGTLRLAYRWCASGSAETFHLPSAMHGSHRQVLGSWLVEISTHAG